MGERPAWLLNIVAVLLTAAALLTVLISPLRNGSHYLVLVAAVMLSARFGGWGPALLSLLLGTAAVAFVLPPTFSFWIENFQDLLGLAIFVSIALFVTILTAAREQAKAAISQRARQQAAVAELGQTALTNPDLDSLMNEAAVLICRTLDLEYSEVLQLAPDGKTLLLRAGHGWREGLVGQARVGADTDSQAGYTLISQTPVVVDDLGAEQRFRESPLLQEHDVVSGMSVMIHGPAGPFGVLGAHTLKGRAFSPGDVSFLQAIANVLAAAVARDESEARVREQRNWLQVTLSSIRDAVMAADEGGRVTFMNSFAESLTGWNAEQAMARPLSEMLKLTDLVTDQPLDPSSLFNWKESSVGPKDRVLLLNRRARSIPIEASAAPIRNKDDQTIGSVLTFRDITERRKIQEQLEFQSVLLRNVHEGVIATDLEGKVNYWNTGAQDIFGYTPEEMAGKSLERLYPDQDAQALAHDLESIAGGTDYRGEWKGRRKDGSLVWMQIKTTLLRNDTGEPIGFIGVFTDITERKQAEERLAAQYAVTRALAESETLREATPRILQAICESSAWEIGVMWDWDDKADVLRCLDVWHRPDLDFHEFEALTREMLFPRNVGLPGRVWASGAGVWVEDILQDPSFARAKVAAANGLRTASAFPVSSGEHLTGVVEFLSRTVRPPDPTLLEMLSALGSQIGQFIERKQAQEALRQSREQQSIILQDVADGVTAQNRKGELIYANGAAARLIGYASPEELLKTPIQQVMSRFHVMDQNGQPVPPDRLPGRVALKERRLAEALLRFSPVDDGGERWSFVRTTPVLDEDGDVRFVINIFHDVTEQKLAEKSLREQRELLHVTLASIADAVISTDTRGDITFMNPVAEALVGWTADEAKGQSLERVLNILDEATGAVLESPFHRVLKTNPGEQFADQALLVTREGRRILIDYSGAPIRDGQGNLVGVVLVFRDISHRRQTERELYRLAAIVNNSEDAILSMTLDGIIRSWNPGAEQLYGYSADEIVGQSISITYPPDRLDEFREIMDRLRRGESVTHFDTIRVRKDGRRIDVSVTPSAIRDNAGRIVGLSKIARDVTARKRAEKAQRFLSEASDVLVSSLDYEVTLASVANLAVPHIADWCSVHILTDDGAVQELILTHVDPAKVQLARELQRRYPPDPDSPSGVAQVIRTGKPVLVEEITENELTARARDVEHLKLLVELHPHSYMIVPLIARERTLGAIAFVSAESGRRYDQADLEMVQELARRAALSVDNARLYRQAQTLNEELEQRVVSRTIELQSANRQLEKEIVERQRSNEWLRLLSGHLQSAREEERVRVAREIHDEIGQVMTAVKMDLALTEREIAKGSDALSATALREQIGSTIRLVDNAIETMHAIVRELRPEILDHLGLRDAIEWQLQEFQTRTKIECHFDAGPGEVDLDMNRSIAVFRILQETLTNIARHSGATRVDVSLQEHDHQLVLQARDNGKGISQDALTDLSTFGILGMRERAHVFGGDVNVVGSPGQGTVVTVRIPTDTR